MNSQVVFIIKVILFSAFLSGIVKYGGALIPITPNSVNAMLIILIPVGVVSTILWWHGKDLDSLESSHE